MSLPLAFFIFIGLCFSYPSVSVYYQLSLNLLIAGFFSFGGLFSLMDCLFYPHSLFFFYPHPLLFLCCLSLDLAAYLPHHFHGFCNRCLGHWESTLSLSLGKGINFVSRKCFWEATEKKPKKLTTQINDQETLHGRRLHNFATPSLNIICRQDGKRSCLILPDDQMPREGQQTGPGFFSVYKFPV